MPSYHRQDNLTPLLARGKQITMKLPSGKQARTTSVDLTQSSNTSLSARSADLKNCLGSNFPSYFTHINTTAPLIY